MSVDTLRELFKNSSVLKDKQALIPAAGHLAPPTYLSTGILPLDHVLGGGFPRGHITLIEGPEGAGKSGLMVDPMLQAVSKPAINGHALYLALEPKVNTNLLYRMGITEEHLTVVRSGRVDPSDEESEIVPLTGDVAFDIIREAIGHFDLIVVDSVAAMSPAVAHMAEAGANQFALVARLLSNQLPLVTAILAATKTALVLINQERASMSQYGRDYKMFGGYALRYYSAITFRMTKTGLIPAREGGQGFSVKAVVEKNSFGVERLVAEWDILFASGVDKVKAAFDTAAQLGIINTRNCKLTTTDGEVVDLNHPGVRGMADAVERLKEEPDLFHLVYNEVIQRS